MFVAFITLFKKAKRANHMVGKLSSFIQHAAVPRMGGAGGQHDASGFFILTVFLLFILPSCIAYAPVPAPAVYRVSSYEIAWENAQRAAEDIGIRITSADETSGTIEGQTNSTTVTIRVERLTDGRIRLEVSLRGPATDAYLADAFHRAYERRVRR